MTLGGFSGVGYVGIQNYASSFTCEDVEIAHTLDGRTYLPFGKAGGCTVAFMNRGRDGQVQSDLVYRRCTARMAYHHGFSCCNTTGVGAQGYFQVFRYLVEYTKVQSLQDPKKYTCLAADGVDEDPLLKNLNRSRCRWEEEYLNHNRG
ncbi:hypothetical protein [Methanosphaerula palustris]|uniref:Uncharacterized protein n=1 Tax=Methanosphaerula palustris (strain ATCC BAA-1556 / DSM 19958 / E1-9c) TaxID=521011 RepID=B8GF86_METPE|nr:hypothetical protein [Methanosphaerula palustris]ACL17892.1 hypothetical protein Mpal_2624 [Methanosphaerula palustris E1-9c]